MKIVIAMNAFKGSLSAREASSLVSDGFRSGFREAQLVELPLADGGDGTADVLAATLGGEIKVVDVTGPLGRPVKARVALVDQGRTAVVESAQASGLVLVHPKDRDVRKAQSRGVGELMLWAARRGCKRIIVGVGGTAMNDGGIGAAQAAGGHVLDSEGQEVKPGTTGLFHVDRVSLGSIPEVFRGVEVVAITDVLNPLAGPDGATRVYGPQKGLKPHEIGSVDAAMSNYAAILGRDLGKDPTKVPMAGAGGGLAAALWAFFGARFESGSRFVMKEVGLFQRIREADLVITGEGAVDIQTAKGKGPFAVAEAAYAAGVPVIVLGGGLSQDMLSGYPPEFAAVFSSTPRPMPVERAIAQAGQNLRFSAEQIARVGRIFALSKVDGRDFSAGGVVVRENGRDLEVLLINDRYGMVALPKGHPEMGESPEDTAVREIAEETGIEATVLGDLGTAKHRYTGKGGAVVEKSVRYFLMSCVGGTLTPQEGETLGVMWLKERDLSGVRTYRDTLAILARGLKLYRERQNSTD